MARSSSIETFNIGETFGVSMGTQPAVDDGELVRLALDGEEEAFGRLVERYRRAAFAVALSVTGHRENAEDVAQEAFLVALERLEDCRKPERFAGWLMTIVRNRARNLIRRESLRDAERLVDTVPSKGRGPAGVTEIVRLRERLEKALLELTEVQREVVLLHDLEGWKHREIAERLNLPAGTVRSHLHFARKALREGLGGQYDRNLNEA
jgi:RNA polymerase sigma-70 factor, ECF subfamily